MNTPLAASVALSYPVAVVLGVTFDVPLLPLAILATLILVASWASLGSAGRTALVAALAGAIALVLTLGAGTWLLYAMPVLIMGLLSWLFARSLLRGSTPLITRYALAMGASDTPSVHRYTRNLTVAWALLCGTLAVASGLLAVFASATTWALFANGVNYLLLTALFLLEYPLRRWLLHNEPRRGFLAYLVELAHVDHQQMLKQP
ncbi:ketosynthase [Thioalkalivibrio sp. ALJ1]|uniref:ketosynthase n=1 Tax=Thioalkalivibrio sp. ALJ1 TaxID=1158144 RepID=UPI00056F695C|nr:ketosynthase [Thioalkalivibrio sp. ALJ1]